MSTYTVVNQVHDTSAGVYRLTYAVVDSVSSNGNLVYSTTTDIVWADDDPQWSGLSDTQIAQAQRDIVSTALAEQESQAQLAVTRKARSLRSLGGEGETL